MARIRGAGGRFIKSGASSAAGGTARGAGLRWNANKVVEEAKGTMVQRMGIVTQYVVGEVKRSINRGQPTRMNKRGRRVGLDPSKAGEPPKKLESDLFKSITSQVEVSNGIVYGRVGTNDVKARRLELGFIGVTSSGQKIVQEERPFLRPAVHSNKPVIMKILGVKK